MMTPFETNILNIYGVKGKNWLQSLPEIVENIALQLGLSQLSPIGNLSYHYVVSGVQGEHPIILKLGLNSAGLKQEAAMLRCFRGHGAVKVMRKEENYLLLNRAVPGVSLEGSFPLDDLKAVDIACQVMKTLHQAKIPMEHEFPHITDWLSVLDKNWGLPKSHLQKARQLRDGLVAKSSPDVLLHGDLHHSNLLQDGHEWVVIDPKGVIGEPAFELAAFIRNPVPKLLEHPKPDDLILSRISRFSERLDVPKEKIIHWSYVQGVLAWAWALGDHCDPRYWEQVTLIFEEMMDKFC